ncbi:MAG: hypothetical protein N2485_01525 [bacterium]|nr:hypothetical protein [bacterium]
MNNIVIPSLYPRSEELIKKTRDFDRNRITEKELEKYFDKDLSDFLNLQNNLNFSYYSTGMFKFKDLLRPFTLILKNSLANTLLRFEETNTFWRKLEISSFDFNYNNFEILFNQYFNLNYILNYLKGLSNINITLPSIFTFYKYSNLNFEQIILVLIELIKNLKNYLNDSKFNNENIIITLVEYLDFLYPNDYNLFKENYNLLVKLIDEINKENFKIFYFTYSNLNKVINEIFSLEVLGISVNFYRNNLNEIDFKKLENKKLLAGVISTESSLIENDQKIIEFFNKISNYVNINNLILTIDFIPYLLPRNIMDNKLKNIINIINLVKK